MSEKIMLNFKLIFVGDSNTGKTAILNQYIYHTFTNTKATTGIDYFTKMFQIDDFIVKLNIFDTAGQQRYLSMTKSYFRGTNAVLFTYSLVEKQSFLNLTNWIKKFEQEAGQDSLKVVVGTKCDLKSSKQRKTQKNNFPSKFNKDEITKETQQRQKQKQTQKNQNKFQEQDSENEISETEVDSLLKNHNITFSFETSALLNQNIEQVFEQICKYLILKQMNKKQKIHSDLNRSRVQTIFSRSKNSQIQDQKLSLQQKKEPNQSKKKFCC